MCKILTRQFFTGLLLGFAFATPTFAQSSSSGQSDMWATAYEPQTRGPSNRELLRRAEQRAEDLRDRLLELQSREFALQTRLDQLDYQMTPEAIQRTLVFVSSVRPLDELRDALRTRLEAEKARVNKQLELLAATREKLESTIREADAEVQRLRQRQGTE